MIEDFLNQNVSYTRDFHKIKYAQMFEHYLDIYGSLVTVRRLNRKKTNSPLPDYDQLINQVYGKVASKDMQSASNMDYTTFETKLILHQLVGMKVHVNMTDQIVTYHPEKILDLGDEVIFRHMGKQTDLHVTDINQYDDVLYEYTLTPIREHVNTT